MIQPHLLHLCPLCQARLLSFQGKFSCPAELTGCGFSHYIFDGLEIDFRLDDTNDVSFHYHIKSNQLRVVICPGMDFIEDRTTISFDSVKELVDYCRLYKDSLLFK